VTTDLWIATGNPKKRDELERLLAPLGYRIRSLDDAGRPIDWDEDRPDFAGNAAIKATTVARAVRAHAVGDDSGLAVDALGGAPGVHSARYAGPDASDADRIEKLLRELAAAGTDRRAHFVCHVCLAGPDGEILARFEERCEGTIRNTPSGAGGFGYDPVVVPDATRGADGAPTFAELGPDRKDAISHRGRALRRLRDWLDAHSIGPRG
jgi:XTP/dITP diphosphohydrolase